MAFVIADRVRESSVSAGTGNFTLAGAVTGYQTFASVMATSDTTYYTIADQGGSNWEVGIGTFTSPSTLARTTILSSSNGGSVVTFGAGTKDVFISLPASKTNVEDQPNLIEVNSSSAALRITQTGAGNALLVEDSANPDATPFAVDANGVLIVGNTASQGTVPVGDGARYTPQTQMQGSAYGTSALSATLFNSAAAGGGGSLALNKSNTNTLGSQAVVASGDVLGTVFFNGSDGTNFVRGAQIAAAVDGTPGTNDMPGRLVFSTTADGASTTTERMRITNAGNVGIGTGSPDALLTVNTVASFGAGAVGAPSIAAKGDLDTGMWFPAANTAAFSTGGSERLRIDSSGNVGIGTSSPAAKLDVDGGIRSRATGSEGGQLELTNPDNASIGAYLDVSSTDIARWFTVRNNTQHQIGQLAGTGGLINFYTAASERMRIDSSGNVGIGTSSPSEKLSVHSAIGIRGSNFASLSYFGSSVNTTGVYTGLDSAGGFVVNVRDAGYQAFSTNNTERMRIDSSGNVGIGTSSPLRVLHVVSNAAETQLLLRESDSSGPQLLMGADSAVSGSIINASSVSGSNNNLLLQTGGTERARIDSNGNVQINTTNAAATGTTCRFTIQDGTTYLPFGINNNAAGTGASNVALFARNGTTTGTISVTGTTTAYNTSSDYRLKHDVQPMLSGLSTISALKPSTYKWNADNSYGEGFIAHELQAVIPQAVSGEKDAVNDDGSIKSQGVDYSKIVVHLVAAIQELKAEIDLLKGKP